MSARSPRIRPYLVILGLLLVPGIVGGASFGVPPATGGLPDGWFLLVGKDAVDEQFSNAFGDITRALELQIEVTTRELQLCIHDPGFFDPGLGASQLDFELGPSGPSNMHFELKDPAGATLKLDSTTFGPDTVATDNGRWCFYDTGAGDPLLTPGIHELIVRYLDGAGADQHVNVFGVETVPDYAAYAYYATVGHAQLAGAGLARGSVRLYPWIVTASAGDFPSGGDACAYDVATYDGDAPVADAVPPEMLITTRLGFVETLPGGGPLPVAEDNVVKGYPFYNLVGLNASDDHGLHTLEIRRLTDDCGGANCVLETNQVPPLPAPLDFNALSFQIYNSGETLPSLFYPVAGADATYEPRRLYLPTAAGGKPAKEWVGHLITNPPASPGLFNQGQTVTLNLQLRIENPTGYDLELVSGLTTVNPKADFSNPTGVSAAGGPGANATATGKVIDFRFNRIRAGNTGRVNYAVDYTPSAVGFDFVTGDGSDFTGGASPTTVTWDTDPAIHLREVAAPCMIQVLVQVAPCAVNAVGVGPAAPVCGGEAFTLDASGSTEVSCSGVLQYRWAGPGIGAPAFSADPTIVTSSTTPGTNSYTIEVRCSTDASCDDLAIVDVEVSDGLLPVADTGGDVVASTCDTFPFQIGTPGDTGINRYVWTSTFPIANLLAAGDELVPQPMFIESAIGLYDLTLTVTSLVNGACFAVDTMTVEVTDGVTSGILGNRLRAIRDSAGDVELSWTTGIITPDRYNVHRADCAALSPPPVACKVEIDKAGLPASYTAPLVNPAAILTGAYTDSTATVDPLYLFEVYGRRCDGTSDVN